MLKAANWRRYNNKPLDLSLIFRQTNLSSGAKLELVVASRTPTPVSVALQLPRSIASSVPGGRLTSKVPSDTSIWLILRQFEEGDGRNLNLTARGNAELQSGSSGAGRLFYEQPVLNIMGRELSTLADLQKTLAQLGFNGGSTLIRLEFRKTEKQLDEAMREILEFFKDDRKESKQETESGSNPIIPKAQAASVADGPGPSEESLDTLVSQIDAATPQTTTQPSPLSPAKRKTPTQEEEGTTPQKDSAPPIPEPLVFRSPSSTTPAAALLPTNDEDYTPSIIHAKLHQNRLQESSINKRLPSEAEIAAAEEARTAKIAATKQVQIRVRLPDQMMLQETFGKEGTGQDLYNLVKSTMVRDQEPFKLVWMSNGPQTVPNSGKKLIQDLGFQGGILVSFVWGDGASDAARAGPVLKEKHANNAQDLVVPTLVSSEPENPSPVTSEVKKGDDGAAKGKGKGLSSFMKHLKKK